MTLQEYLLNHRILILYGPPNLKKYPNITVDDIYQENLSVLQKNWRKLAEHIPGMSLKRWYADWKYAPAGYDLIVIVNGIRDRELAEYLRKANPNSRIIIYYETLVDYTDRKAPHHYENLGIEFYSFDKGDCQKLNLNYNHYYYFYQHNDAKDIREQQKNIPVSKDIFFCGYDKGRLKQLIDLQESLNPLDMDNTFWIVKTPHKRYKAQFNQYLTDHALPYERLEKELYKSRAILDYNIIGQNGITQRPMEALFYRKKLITNNPAVREYDFYNENNIFVLGEQSLEELKDFVRSPYVIPDNETELLYQYSPEGWLERFNL